MLEILEEFCEKESVVIEYGARAADAEPYLGADLVLGADGVRSVVRDHRQQEFGTRRYSLTNRITWYGTTQDFPYPSLSFKRNEFGHFVTAAYACTERMSTFVAECNESTYSRAGPDRVSDGAEYPWFMDRYGHRWRPEAVSA